jgi:hypothetical protein
LLLADITAYWNKADPLTTSVAEKVTLDELGKRVDELRVMDATTCGICLGFYFYIIINIINYDL